MAHPLRILASAAILTTAALPAAAQRLFTADQEACFGRAYDRAHLASHPNQKVTSFHLLRSLGEREEAENWRPDSRQEEIELFRDSGEAHGLHYLVEEHHDEKGIIWPVALRTYHLSRTCGSMREGASPCTKTFLTRPRSMNWLT